MRIRRLRVSLAMFIFAAAAFAGSDPSLDKPHPWIGRDAPAFKARTLDGKKFDSASLRGKWTVLMFGATWCPYTNGKAVDLKNVLPKYQGMGIDFYAVNVAEPERKVEKWVERREVSCPVLLDPKGKASALYVPEEFAPDYSPRHELVTASTFVIDPAGKIRYVDYCGPKGCATRDLSRVTAELDRLLKT